MLRQTPLLGDHAHRIAQGFLRLWPYDALYWFVSKTLGFPPHAAEVTTRWLKSRDGVWQSLHLGMGMCLTPFLLSPHSLIRHQNKLYENQVTKN